jgi:hypothetical protein
MSSHADVAAALQRIQQLHATYEGAMDAAVGAMNPNVWIGPGADAFAAELTGRRSRMKQALESAVGDAQRLLASTPADTPVAAGGGSAPRAN